MLSSPLGSDVVDDCLFDVIVDRVDLLEAVDFLDEAHLRVMLNDWQLLVFVLLQTLAKGLNVVVGAAWCALAALLNTLDQSVLIAHEVEDASEIDAVAHDLVPTSTVVFIPREAIYKELLCGPASSLHRVLDQAASNCHGNDLAFLDDSVDHFTVLRAGSHLSAEEITSRQVDEAIVLNQFRALGSLSGTWASTRQIQ